MRKIKKSYAFTLAEVLFTLTIIGVVASLTIPTVVKSYQEQQTVTKLQKFYKEFSTIVREWQIEKKCSTNIRDCLIRYPLFDCDKTFEDIRKNMKIVNYLPNVDNGTTADWLPQRGKLLNGQSQYFGWQGVSQMSSGRTCLFQLIDGATMNLQVPDNYGQSGFLYYDVNGKKEPNRLGVDVFPFGLGAYGRTDYPSVHPYYSEDSADGAQYTGGLCTLRGGIDCSKTVDTCTKTSCSPTAYVIKHGKLPKITW